MESDKQDNSTQRKDEREISLNAVVQDIGFMENKLSVTPEEGKSTTTLVDKEEDTTAGLASQISVSNENEAELQQVVSKIETAVNSEGTKSNAIEVKDVFEQSASTMFEQSFESAKSLNDSILFENLPENKENKDEVIAVTHEKQPNIASDNVDVESIVMQEIQTLVKDSVVNPAETLDSGVPQEQIINQTQEDDSRVQATHESQNSEFSGNEIATNVKETNTENSQIEKELQMDTSAETEHKIGDATAVNNNQSAPKITEASSGLSLLAQYDSDNDGDNGEDNDIEKISDTDSIVEITADDNLGYRKKVIEIDSDTTSDSSESEVEYLAEIRKTIEKSIEGEGADEDDDADDDENSGKTKRQAPRVKGEFLIDDLPPIQDLHITVPEEECIELGKVHSIVDQLVLVNALPNSVLLDLETVLFFDKGQRVLGEVFDVLGQVADPLYCVRFNSNKQIKEKNIQIGEVVYVAPKTQYTQFVILSSLMKMRGSDASWENDIEPPPRYLDYSDDEQEREARSRRRNKDRPYDHIDLTKRTRSDIDCEMEGTSPSPSPSPSPSQQHHQRRVPLYLRGRDDTRPQRYQQQPRNFRSNYNASSWHSNYPQHYRGPFPPPNFAPSPHMQFNTMFPPPNFAGYPPRQGGMPTQQPGQQPPMYVLNPYAVRPPVLGPRGEEQMPMYLTQPPPPPPPGAQ